MKLYLSSYRIPAPRALAQLLGKPLAKATLALLPNAQDYYSDRAREWKIGDLAGYLQQLGLKVTVVDLRDYSDAAALKQKLASFDLVWAMGGNTYMLRYEMRRSGFDAAIRELLADGVVYGGDSAGALVAGISIAGVESADNPAFAQELIKEGVGLVPFVLLPHVDNPEFAGVLPGFRELHRGTHEIIELKDSQAVIFENGAYRVIDAELANDGSVPHEHESQPELARRLANAAQQVTVGVRYRHYKQLNYKVVALALREEDNEPCVVYQAEYGERLTWIRPVDNWLEEIEADGKRIRRFTKIA